LIMEAYGNAARGFFGGYPSGKPCDANTTGC